MKNIILIAIELAEKWHQGQMYGDEPYIKHLERVAKTVEKYGSNKPSVIAAAWLHDILEDTRILHQELYNTVGDDIYRLVNNVTDKEGDNRLERQLNTYSILRKCKRSVIIKLADRIVNMKKSIRNNSSQCQMYKHEYIPFKFALYDKQEPGHTRLWEILDGLYTRL